MHTNQTFASNFYPITSAIAARDKDTDLQVTVMTDRTQSGAAGLQGNNSIELMQHRRLLIDDSKGLTQPIDERDEKGRGIQVKAKYWLQVFHTNKTESAQRYQQ